MPYFNSQPRKGTDESVAIMVFCDVVHFNSQPRKGTDRAVDPECRLEAHFNSQPRKGTDMCSFAAFLTLSISTHSPARGLTGNTPDSSVPHQDFNSQPRKGTDALYIFVVFCHNISTHSPARGLTIRDIHSD